MEPFVYENPVKIIFGAGCRKSLHEILKGKYHKVLIVCAMGPFRKNGFFDCIADEIKASGAEVFEMPDVNQNPRLSSVRLGMKLCRENGVECVAALGGGSAMDCAKLIAASAKTGIDPYEYVFGSRPRVEASLDTIMIPTIAATGTECNNSSVIVNDETKEKYYCDCFYPKYAVLDPELTATVPYRLLLWGAMDILSHTFEYYFNGYTQSEFQTNFSEAILKSVISALNQLADFPDDLNARGELMYCAVMAWGGLTKIGRGAPDMTCHSIEESFSGYFDTHHGGCLGVLTPRWMEIVAPEAEAVFARFARNVMKVQDGNDDQAAQKGIREYRQWLCRIGAPDTYSDLSDREFSNAELDHVAQTAFQIYRGKIGRLKSFTLKEIKQLLYSGKKPYNRRDEQRSKFGTQK